MERAMKELLETGGEPAVSILCPLDTRRPGNPRDPRVLANLRDRAADRVASTLDGPAASSLISRIDDSIASIDLAHPSPSVAVLVAPEITRVLPLDEVVEPRVTVGRSFATHDLVAALARHIRGRALVLAQTNTRCIDVTGHELFEHRDEVFPVAVEPPTEADAPHRDFPLDEHEHAEAVKFVFRAVDHALGALQKRDARPLVLMGTERDLAYFEGVTNYRTHVVGRVYGSHERDTLDEIGALTRSVLAEHAEAQQQATCDDLREALGTGAVSGIADVWKVARDGRARVLVVEDGYRFDAIVVDGELVAAPNGDASAFDAVDDAVDAVIRQGGEVVPVSAGRLGDLGGIASLLRY
jgi:hypothetical protein